MWPLPHKVHDEIDEYEGAVASKARMAVSRNEHIQHSVRYLNAHFHPTLSMCTLLSFSYFVSHGGLPKSTCHAYSGAIRTLPGQGLLRLYLNQFCDK